MNTRSCIQEKINTCNIKYLTLVLVHEVLFILKYGNKSKMEYLRGLHYCSYNQTYIFKLTKPSVASLTICTSFFIRNYEYLQLHFNSLFMCLVVYTVYILIHPYLSSQKSDLLILSLIILIPNVDFMKMLTSMKHISLFIINDYLFMICTFFIVAV